MKWYKRLGNIITVIICILLIPLLLINISIIIQANTNKNTVPSIFGYKPFIVLSGSMETEIHKGDLIIVKNINPEELKVNDVIAFKDQQDTITTHRIIEVVEKNGTSYFVTKGDNNSSQDQNLVEYKDVEGIYAFKISKVGSLLNTLSNPTVIVVLVFVITIIFGLCFYVSSKKQASIEMAEFLEYKRLKELEEKENKNVVKDSGKSTKEAKNVKPGKSSNKK